MIKESLS